EFPLEQIEINDVLYESSTGTIIDFIRGINDKLRSVMIFGHNPDFTDLANHFADPLIDNIPTAGAVILKFKTAHWKSIDRDNLEKQLFYFPNKDE
ncbi:MAG TPA: hypothetical protein VJ346_01620, partial [Bacteroidales bacterium]|nr:hypothetical protein [Bacteroidales bacterium]